jgi:hypothetical protein
MAYERNILGGRMIPKNEREKQVADYWYRKGIREGSIEVARLKDLVDSISLNSAKLYLFVVELIAKSHGDQK